MLKDYNRYRVLKIFLDSPTESFRIRELSRMSKLAPASVMNYLREFELGGLIKRFIKRRVPFYQALLDNERFKLFKKISIIYELDNSGLIEELWEKLAPDAIILYGSYAKGESVEESDIDLFIIGKEKEIKLEEFEEKLGKRVHIIFDEDVKNIPKELKNNLVNGYVLKGYFKLF